jgi:hypothetical protein
MGVLMPVAAAGGEIPDDAYAITFSDGQRIYTSQCGLNVTVFLLELFKLDYDLNETAARLKPDADGISLASIQEALQAHGLDAQPRRGLSLRDLRGPLKAGMVAVIPIKAGPDRKERHYVIALYQRGRGDVLVDVPRAVGPLFQNLAAEDLSEPVALFVRPAEETNRLAARVEIIPSSLDLGVFALSEPGGQNPVDRVFKLKNKSQGPVVLHLDPSCGCMLPDWTGGYLEKNETREVRLRTSPGSWGIGRYVRPIYVSFPDHSDLRVDVIAEAVAAETLQKLALSQTSFSVDCTHLADEAVIERQAEIEFTGGPPKPLSVRSSADWLEAFIAAAPGGNARLTLRARPTAALLADSRSQVEAQVQLAADDKVEPVTVKMRLFRRDFYELADPVVALSRGSSSPAEAFIRPVTDIVERLDVMAIESQPAGIIAETGAAEGGAVRIVLRAPPDLPPGQSIVRCHLRGDDKVEGVAYLLVNITP